MSLIEMSAGFASGLQSRLCRQGDYAGTGMSDLGIIGNYSGNNYFSFFQIFKGTIPTIATLTDFTVRATDRLVEFDAPADFIAASKFTNPMTLTSVFKAASTSGTASWFRLCSINGNSMLHQLIGTVGLVGAVGADLEMDSLVITAGSMYKIANFRMQFPTSWTY